MLRTARMLAEVERLRERFSGLQAEVEQLRERLRAAPRPMMLSDAKWDEEYEEWWRRSAADTPVRD